MACSKSTLFFKRPSVILLGLCIVASLGTSLVVQGSPIPDDTGKTIEATFNTAVKTTDDFFTRTKNTFYGRAEPNEPGGLSTLELSAVIACAVILLFVGSCCIMYCLCECVKELICCICCCKCCRD